MIHRDRVFVSGVVITSAVVPGTLVAATPVGEMREVLGHIAGWSVALALMVPSYWLLARMVRAADHQAFLRGLLGGTLGRLAAMVLAVVAFATLVEDAPLKSFLLSFGLGYLLLTGLELTLALRPAPDRGSR